MKWMRPDTLLSILAAGALGAGSVATARPDALPEMLAPASPWNMDYGVESCRLIRTFGPAGSRVMIKFEKFSLNDRPSLMVVGKASADLFRVVGAIPDGALNDRCRYGYNASVMNVLNGSSA